MAMNNDIILEQYYSCQLKVPRFGATGQQILQNTKCLIIGLGGLGCPVAQYLVASGVGYLGLADADFIEISSINRQILFHPKDIGTQKSKVAKEKLSSQNPFIHIHSYNVRIDERNWQDILSKYDIIIDCTDNFHSKFLIHDSCRILKKDLVQAGIYQTSGQVYYFNFSSLAEKDESSISSNIACLRCIWQDIPDSENQQDCSRAGVLATVAGTVAMTQANTALHAMLKKTTHLKNSMQIFDWENLQWTRLTIPKNLQCCCNSKEEFLKVSQYLYSKICVEITELPVQESTTSTSAKGDADKLKYIILDVRDEENQINNKLFGNMPVERLSTEDRLHFTSFIKEFPEQNNYILVCYAGVRSLQLTKKLHKYGKFNACSLVGGYDKLEYLYNNSQNITY